MGSKHSKKKGRKCYICNCTYPINYILYHEDRCGVRVNGEKLLTDDDKKKRIK